MRLHRYTGTETKVEQNTIPPPQKRSNVEKGVNTKLIWLFLLQTIICVVCSVGHNQWRILSLSPCLSRLFSSDFLFYCFYNLFEHKKRSTERKTRIRGVPGTLGPIRSTTLYLFLTFLTFLIFDFCFVLFCFVLFCFVLFCFVLFCFVLFCFVLFCFVLFCFVLFCFVFFDERTKIYVSYIILYNTLIPLSMYVSMEMVRVVNAQFINNDLEMYDEKSDILKKKQKVRYLFAFFSYF